jgi:hypothetical protein
LATLAGCVEDPGGGMGDTPSIVVLPAKC